VVGVGTLGRLALVRRAALEQVVDADRLEDQDLLLDVNVALGL
jgi:hypothetical protein